MNELLFLGLGLGLMGGSALSMSRDEQSRRRAFIEACALGDLGLFKDSPLPIALTDNELNEIIFRSAQEGHATLLRDLVVHHPLILGRLTTLRDKQGMCPLHTAALQGRQAVFEMLREAVPSGAERARLGGVETPDGWTPLHAAASEGHVAVVRELFQHWGATANHQNQGGHTALWVAACNGHNSVVEELLLGTTPDQVDPTLRDHRSGRTPLFMAAMHGRADTVDVLLRYCAKIDSERSEAGTASHDAESPLLARVLALHDTTGYSALHAACFARHPRIATTLMRAGLSPLHQATNRDTPLHVCARFDAADVAAVLLGVGQGDEPWARAARDTTAQQMEARNVFGSTPFHVAARCASNAVISLLARDPRTCGALLLQDNDGLQPLHELGHAVRDDAVLPKAIRGSLQHILDLAAASEHLERVVAGQDFGGGTCLHALCCDPPPREVTVELVETLLARGADPSVRNDQNWTPLHYVLAAAPKGTWAHIAHKLALPENASTEVRACRAKLKASNIAPDEPTAAPTPAQRIAVQLARVIARHSLAARPAFLSAFDPSDERDRTNRAYLARRGAASRIPAMERWAVLRGDTTLRGVAQYLLRFPEEHGGRTPKVVLMTGAGMSTAAGIPDFRSPGSGLYTGAQGKSTVFSLECMLEDPARFNAMMRELFLPVVQGKRRPTAAHYLARLLEDRGMLQRWYTQNVDTLDTRVGVTPERIVEAHGSVATAHCAHPPCPHARPWSLEGAEMQEHVWDVLARDDDSVPRCPACGHLLVPDVVFFGAPLPPRFGQESAHDLPECDLLLVLGTSLVVYPFAGLPNQVPDKTPRVLINQQATGPFRALEEAAAVDPQGDCAPPHEAPPADDTEALARLEAASGNYRDVLFLGDCDEGVQALCRHLGWADELSAVFRAG